ncbi:MAG: hypothetical protein LN588_01405 [Rickettsia endosymbiont of Bryobia graminum]|nr:hypothetical protein [Rickettsia endosymbiont of Bryobia graminum]
MVGQNLSKNHPITIMFEDELSNTPYYSLLWTVLGTLLIADLTTVAMYHREYNEIIFENLQAPTN